MSDGLLLTLIALLLVGLFLLLRVRSARKQSRGRTRPHAVIDGSNVMHWRDNTPQLEPVKQVLRLLDQRGYQAGVMFDANAGYRLTGQYLHDGALGKRLGLTADRVMVVPKGEQADPFLLRYASDAEAILVSDDRFRDRIADYPKMAQPGRLVRGGWQDGKVWLDLP